MNKPYVQPGAQSAARTQDHAADSTQIADEALPLIPAEKGDAQVASRAAKTGDEIVSMGSPAFGLGGRPVPKDAIHNNT
jgi:hypothetical protein